MKLMLDKKQVWVTFLFEFKMGCKAAETTRNINNAFGSVTANEHTVQWWLKKFCKRDESLEDEECRGWPSEDDNDQLRVTIKGNPLIITWEIAKKVNINHSMDVQHLKQMERWKSLVSGCLITENQRNHRFEVSSFLLHKNNEPFLVWIVMCNEKWILYDNWWQPAQ